MNSIAHKVINAVNNKVLITIVSKRVMSTVAGNQTEGPIASTIRRKLVNSNLQPTMLEIVNESHMHNVPPNSETHFKLFIVSSAFDNTNLISRHRMIHTILQSELDKAHGGTVHALSMVCKTPQQWDTLLHQKGVQKHKEEEDDDQTKEHHTHHDPTTTDIIRQVMGISPKCRGGDGSLSKKS